MGLFIARTFPEIYGGMVDKIIATTPVTDVNFGSVLSTMLEAAAQEDDEQYFQMLEIIRGYSLDTTSGSDLDNRAFEYGLTRSAAKIASTFVTISDTAISKVETGVYSGLPGASAGSMAVNGDSAAGFSSSGSIIVGRGTPNAETVAYSSITNNTNYVTFNLSIGLAHDHGTDETIILSQGGNRNISAGTAVSVPASDINPKISFTLSALATILDGESEVQDITVTASEAGSKANVPVGAISKFDSPPFSTATVSNPERVTNGADIETDQGLRDRIKDHIQSLSRGTGKAIITSVIGVLSSTENKRVISASLVEPTLPADVVKLFIDDGTGFVPSWLDVGFEELVIAATGGEKYITAANFPVVKAFVETQNSETYNLVGGETLFVSVGGQTETITFASNNFATPGAATAQEVLQAINSNATNFEARLSGAGLKVRIFARANSDEQIQVTGGTANSILGFPTDVKFTTKLYLERADDISLLSKDGITAAIESGTASTYDLSARDYNLAVVVDGKVKNRELLWFTSADFIAPSAATAAEIVTAINAQLAGADASLSSNNTKFTLTSKTKRDATSKIRIIENFTSVQKYNGAYTDITSQAKTTTNVQLFAADSDYVYLGHSDVPFNSVYWKLAINASASMGYLAQYWNGSTWNTLGVTDGTVGFTQTGYWAFRVPHTWTKNTVNGATGYFIRVQRVQPVLVTPPTEALIKISSANDLFGFSETEVVGTNKDYTFNRFLGQFELVSPLQAGDYLTLGSKHTRAGIISGQGPYNLSGTETLIISVDGVSQTITFNIADFATPGAATASEVAARINTSIAGAVATVVATNSKVKIVTNGYAGSLQVTGGTSNTALGFPTALKSSLTSHIPSTLSGAGPFTFASSTSLIVVVDKNVANNFTVPLYTAHTSTTGTVAASVVCATLNATYPLASDLVGYEVLFTSGGQSGNRKTVSAYDPVTGTLTMSVAFAGAPGVGSTFQLLPKTVVDAVKHLNNKKITLLSTKAVIESAEGGTKVQISSQLTGETAAIQVTGGTANAVLGFGVSEKIGVDAYRYFTGLAQLTQWTVDGKLSDQTNYPGQRAAGVQVEVLDPVTKPISVALNVTTNEGVTLSSIANDVKSAVSSYINSLPVGGDVIISSITCAVKEVAGVFDVEVTTPSANVAVADNELAKVNEAQITVG
jgi:uncharacterized phage protein gp47/JayE